MLSNIKTELEANKVKLMDIFRSGQTSYITHLLQTEVWDSNKDKIGDESFTNIEALSKIYSNLKTLNKSIEGSLSTPIKELDYSRPPFPRLREICEKTSKDIEKWVEYIRSYIP